MTPLAASNLLFKAARIGAIGDVRKALEAGADVNAQDWFRQTALHHATTYGHVNIVKLLIEKRADVLAKDSESCTPLDLAVTLLYPDIAAVLEAAAKLPASQVDLIADKRQDGSEPQSDG